uniref:VOC family protein n=1 Tax=Pedobacter schmidteae TaxID=2201271 RepID=UPI000EADB808|nr:VOC family protein [Pedobacter schmidteae]
MKAFSSATVIHVSNFRSALDYYTKILGFTFDFEFGEYAGLFIDEVFIHISGSENPGRKKPAGSAHLCIDIDNVDDYYQRLTANGAIISVTLEDRVYGMRDFAVNDPDGNTLVFGQAIAPAIL